jgi:aminoglycoside phosphotransferase (APT) family kinase protein
MDRLTSNSKSREIERDCPNEQFIQSMRERYPTEHEIDWAFTRRQQRRAQGPFKPPSLDDMVGYLNKFLQEKVSSGFEIRDPEWLGGGGSKLQMRFTLDTELPLMNHLSRTLVLRMEPAESLNPSSRLREAQIISALQGKVPLPEMYWVDRDGKWFPEPALIYSFSSGVAKPTQFSNKRVTGLGINFGPTLRRKLGLQFVRHMATFHNHELTQCNLTSFDMPSIGTTEAARWQVNRALRCWEEDREEPMALLDVAGHWLERNLPALDHASLIHGDYRSGNFLYNERSEEITAVLDWERCTIGDRHRDLAWATSEAIGHFDESGQTFLICGLMPLSEFIEEYERASGLKVDPQRLHFYTVLSRYQQAATVLGTSYRVVKLRRSHQDILLSRIEAASYVLLEELRQALETSALVY